MENIMKKNKKKKIIGILLAALVICTLLPLGVFGSDVTPKDITSKVSFGDVEIQANALKPNSTWEKDWQTFIKNGQITDSFDDYKVIAGESLRVYCYWSISEENMPSVNDGDYFEIPIDESVLKLDSIKGADVYASDASGNEIVIGKLKVTDNKLVITLNSEGANASELSEGWVMGIVSVKDGTENQKTTEIAGVDIVFDFTPKDNSGGTSTGTIYAKSDPGAITKTGWISDGNRNAEFTLQVNGDALFNKMKSNTDVTVRENVIVKDFLPSNLKYRTDVAPVSFYAPYYIMMGDSESGKNTSGQVSSTTFSNPELKKVYTKIDTTGMSLSDFEKKIESTPNSYGIFEDVYFMANMGNMPDDSLMMPLTKAQISDKLLASTAIAGTDDSRYINSMAAYNNVYGSNANVPVLSVSIVLRTDYTGRGGDKDQATNTASVVWKNSKAVDSSTTKKFSVYSGGANMGEKYSVTIEKKDGDTQELLNGVEFKLEKFNSESNSYTQYKSLYDDEIKATTDGAVLFHGLSKGKYKIVEEKGLDGYTDKIEFVDANGDPADGTFEITGEEKGTIKITANNYKEETPTEGAIETTPTEGAIETTPGAVAGEERFPDDIIGSTDDNSNVLGEEGTPDAADEGSVLGDEAKTGDPMNMVPLLVMVLVVAILILAVSVQAKKRKE